MFARTAAALLLLLGLGSARAGAAEPVVLVINNTNAPPFTTPARDGFLDVIVAEALGRSGARPELVRLPAERALLSANDGIIDGDLTRIAGLESLYPNLLRVPETLVEWEFVAFGKDPAQSADLDSIRSRVVGHITGWKIYEKALQGAPHVVGATSPRQLFELLGRDRIEVALHARWMGRGYIREMGLEGIHQLDPPLARREMFLYLHRRHAERVEPIARALRDLKREGFYQRVWQEKVAPYAESPDVRR